MPNENKEKKITYDVSRFQSKVYTILYFLFIFAALFFTSRWVNKDLYIKSVVSTDLSQSNGDNIVNTSDMEAFQEISQQHMLEYLRSKYGEDFGFINFSDGGLLSMGEMTAYPKNGSDLLDQFTISQQDNGSYQDSYMDVIKRKEAQRRAENVFRDAFSSFTDRYVHVSQAQSDAVSRSEVGLLPMSASIEVLIDEADWNRDSMQLRLQDLAKSLQKAGLSGTLTLKSVRLNNFDELNDYTLAQYNTDNFIVDSVSCTIEPGSIAMAVSDNTQEGGR